MIRRVILGHIGATVVDLACRGCLRMEPLDEDGWGWRLITGPNEPEDLLAYEQALLHRLFMGRKTMRMADITPFEAPLLDLVRAGIVGDALDAGRLRAGVGRRLAVTKGQRRRYDQKPRQRTRLGAELLKEIKAFKRDLRALEAVGDTRTLARFASYAMIFGLAAPLPHRDLVPGQPSDEAVPPKQTTEFADCWLKAWGYGRSDFLLKWDPYSWQSDDYALLHNYHGYAHHGGDGGFNWEHGGHGGGHHGGGHHGGGGGHG